jgi:hypothetical protein
MHFVAVSLWLVFVPSPGAGRVDHPPFDNDRSSLAGTSNIRVVTRQRGETSQGVHWGATEDGTEAKREARMIEWRKPAVAPNEGDRPSEPDPARLRYAVIALLRVRL